MLFQKSTYTERRNALRQLVGNGLIVLFGNNDSPMNYPANAYKFRQDSSFLYFFGLNVAELSLLMKMINQYLLVDSTLVQLAYIYL